MKKRLFLSVLVLAAALTACTQTPAGQDTPSGDDGYTVGICQLVQHAAHDDATRGFMDALNEALPGQVTFRSQVASNDITVCSGIINRFITEEADLILANATPALQIASAATDEIPILGTSVTEYGAALGIKNFSGTPGGNVSGTSDLAPLDQQAQMVAEWFPDAENVGLLYCSAEANSRYQVDVMTAELEKLGYTCRPYPFTDANDLPLVLAAITENCDVVYVPTDNTVAVNSPIIDNACRWQNVPVIGGDAGLCAGCSVATLCIDYYDLGVTTGEMAAKILTGEADISEMPIAYADAYRVYNPDLCADLGLTPPSGDYAPLTD